MAGKGLPPGETSETRSEIPIAFHDMGVLLLYCFDVCITNNVLLALAVLPSIVV